MYDYVGDPYPCAKYRDTITCEHVHQVTRLVFTEVCTTGNADCCNSYTISVRPSVRHVPVFCPEE